MKQLITKILANERLGESYFKMRIQSAYLAKTIKPGQFIEARCCDKLDPSFGADHSFKARGLAQDSATHANTKSTVWAPLLRRPFSVHRILKDSIEVLYEVIGKGTEILSRKKAGETLDIIGPLGNGFELPPQPGRFGWSIQQLNRPGCGGSSAILIAGGMGVAPLVALAEKIAYSIERIADRKKIHVLIGAKTKTQLLCKEDFRKLGFNVIITTDDGSKGKKGFVTEELKKFLRYPLPVTRYPIYACGPYGMLKEVARIAESKNIPCQVSLEEKMACGVGVCLGCPVKIRLNNKPLPVTRYPLPEYKMACKDGPVFNAKEIIWE